MFSCWIIKVLMYLSTMKQTKKLETMKTEQFMQEVIYPKLQEQAELMAKHRELQKEIQTLMDEYQNK